MQVKLILMLGLLSIATRTAAQSDWIAPEGKIINYRTLVWNDFLGKPGRGEEQYGAATQPAIYITADSAAEHPNNRLTFVFHVKCAFQSASWVRENLGKAFSVYALNHEQDHYDIALAYANKLQADLNGRDYSTTNYQKEIDDIYDPLYKKYDKTQDDYDGQTDHGLIKENQSLWDMRIKKCFETGTDAYFASTEKALQSVKLWGDTVKRLNKEPFVQMAVRCRPMYTELTDELTSKIIEFKEWTTDKAILVFYLQGYTRQEPDEPEVDGKRLLACAFMPLGNNGYKRVLVDTFCVNDKIPQITSVFFANADTEDVKKELLITFATDIKDKQQNGKMYATRVYDNTGVKFFPSRLRKLVEINEKLVGGFDGIANGKTVKALYKDPKSITEQLVKMGYKQE